MERVSQSKSSDSKAPPAKPLFQVREVSHELAPDESMSTPRAAYPQPDYAAITRNGLNIRRAKANSGFADPATAAAPSHRRTAPSIQPQIEQENESQTTPDAGMAWQAPARSLTPQARLQTDEPSVPTTVRRSPLDLTQRAFLWNRSDIKEHSPSPTVQAKSAIEQPDNPEPQRLSHIARAVMNQSPAHPKVQPEVEDETEEIQPKPLVEALPPLVQRQAVSEDEEPLQAKCESCAAEESIQRSSDGAGTSAKAPTNLLDILIRNSQNARKAEATPLQPKLTIGQPGDRYEQEADQVAATVMAMPEPTHSPIQRQELAEAQESEEEPEEIQTKPLVDSITPLVQRQPEEDSEEIQTKESEEEPEEIQAKPVVDSAPPIQRQSEDESEEVQAKSEQAPSTTSNLETQLANSKGGGSPLGDDVRSFMESRFNSDFSHVRVHTDSSAVQMNKDLRAQAFTHGSNIYFGAGKSPGQNELTAHELTHVVQQTGARKPNKELQLRLKSRTEVDNTIQNSKPGQRTVTSVPKKISLIKDAGKDTSAKQEKAKSQLEPASQLQSNKEAVKANHSPALSQPAVDTKVKGETQEKPQPASEQAKTKVGTPDISHGQNAAPASSPNLAPTAKTQSATGTAKAAMDSGAIASMDGAASMPQAETASVGAIGDVGGSAVEAEAPATEDDRELEAAASETEGVELEAGDRADAAASLTEITDGGAAPAEAGGGGGGGAAIADKPAPPVPDVSGADPAQALSTLSQLPPAQFQAGLGGVTAAVGSTVGKERAELAANPPQMERPTGSPVTKEGTGDRAIPTSKTPKQVEKAPQGQAQPTPQPKPLPPLPPPPTQAVPQPPSDPQAIKASLDRLPTQDPSLNITAREPPPLNLQGDANPQQAQEQQAKLEKSLSDNHAQGQQDLAQPMGEDEIYPHVPKETLKAEGVGAGGGGAAGATGGGAGGAAKGAEGDDAVSIIAQQEHGQEIQAAVSQAQSQMAAKRQEHTVQVAQEKDKSNKEITKLQSDNEAQQAQERSKAQAEVGKQKEAWNKEQTDLVNKSRKDSDAAVAKGLKDVEQEQTQAETKAQQHIEKGNQDAETARKQGEEQAAAEKQKGNQESGGIFGWLADRAKAFFDGIKQAIQKAFEIARAAVKAAIETAKKLATEVIEAARKAIVSIIKFVGDALIAIGDVLLAAFPEMRDRFRNAIKSAVKAAETAVNALADKLKQGVVAALNLLGRGLDAALGLLEKGMLAAVDVAKAAVQGAISAAKVAVEALGAFAVLAKDIAANPGQWLSNLGAGVMDGIRNHLWVAFQTAVKEWFNQKVEELLGLGTTVWNLLKKGGMGMAQIGQMAWEGIKSAIPPALIQILIEKLVAMIVPAAGAVLAVIEGLQAAWGTVSRILQAMERFMAFLKVVKSGQSVPPFGALLAAAGVILIDFVANWLLKRVRGAASKVAGKIREIAKKIGDKLKGAFARLKKGAGKLKDKFFGKKGDKSSKGKDTKPKQDKEKDDLDKKQKKVDRAVNLAVVAVNALSGKRIGKIALGPVLAGIKQSFGLRILEPVKQGENWAVHGEINPTSTRVSDKKVADAENAEEAKHQSTESNSSVGRGRRGGFRQAKQKAGIPNSVQPTAVRREEIRDHTNPNGSPIYGRVYEFRKPDGSIVEIREHSLGHPQYDKGPHFNTELRPPGGGPRQPLIGEADDHSFFDTRKRRKS